MYGARPSLKSSYTLDGCVATVFLRACCEKPNSYQDEFAIWEISKMCNDNRTRTRKGLSLLISLACLNHI